MTHRRLAIFPLVALATLFLLVACETSPGGTFLGPDVTDSDLLYGDDFSEGSAGPWLLEGDESGATVVENGRMLIEVAEPGTLQFTTLQEPAFTDFDLTVESELIEGGREATLGLLFRMAGPEAFYRFELTGDGRYIVERRDAGGDWTRLVDGWQRSEAIASGAGAMNRLRMTAVGPLMTFYANDELLTEVQDSRYVSGTIALDAGSFGGQRTVAAFDNLAVRAP